MCLSLSTNTYLSTSTKYTAQAYVSAHVLRYAILYECRYIPETRADCACANSERCALAPPHSAAIKVTVLGEVKTVARVRERFAGQVTTTISVSH